MNVLVTGASGAIGSEIARTFAATRANVVLGYNMHEEPALELEKELGANALAVKADVSKEEDVERLFAAGREKFGFIDVLINNAGISYLGLLSEMSLADWERVLAVNLTSAFLCSRKALGEMVREKSGCIINISSIWGQVGASCEAAYSASKAGLIGLSKALAKEEGPSGIRVNCIAPGLVESPMNGDLTDEEISAFCGELPLGRAGKPEEIAAAALFLAENEYITGQVLGINGGM